MIAICFIIDRYHGLFHETLWRKWIAANHDIIRVFFHYKHAPDIRSDWIRANLLPIKWLHTSSYFDVVPSYFSLLVYAFTTCKDIQWFCLATESCVPIITPQNFRAMYFRHYSKSIMRWKSAYWNPDFHRRANLRYLTKDYWLANDPWFVLCRYHVECCHRFMVTKNALYKKILAGGLANESIFAIILKTYHQLNDHCVINDGFTICDWSRMASATSPYIFTDSDSQTDVAMIRKLMDENPHACFLRKVAPTFSDAVLEQIASSRPQHSRSIYAMVSYGIAWIVSLALSLVTSICTVLRLK